MRDDVLEAHRRLGFPALPTAIQAGILLSGDYSPIQDLAPDCRVPFPLDLVRNYITISREEFMDYLIHSDFVERNQEEYLEHPQRDGMWIRNTNEGFEIIWQERGHVDEVEEYNSRAALEQRLCTLLYQQFGNK